MNWSTINKVWKPDCEEISAKSAFSVDKKTQQVIRDRIEDLSSQKKDAENTMNAMLIVAMGFLSALFILFGIVIQDTTKAKLLITPIMTLTIFVLVIALLHSSTQYYTEYKFGIKIRKNYDKLLGRPEQEYSLQYRLPMILFQIIILLIMLYIFHNVR